MHVKKTKLVNGISVSNKPFLYILSDAVVMEAVDSRLLKEVLANNPDLKY